MTQSRNTHFRRTALALAGASCVATGATRIVSRAAAVSNTYDGGAAVFVAPPHLASRTQVLALDGPPGASTRIIAASHHVGPGELQLGQPGQQLENVWLDVHVDGLRRLGFPMKRVSDVLFIELPARATVRARRRTGEPRSIVTFSMQPDRGNAIPGSLPDAAHDLVATAPPGRYSITAQLSDSSTVAVTAQLDAADYDLALKPDDDALAIVERSED